MPVYKDPKTGKWFAKVFYENYEGEKIQKKKMGFELKREAQEWERVFFETQQYSPDINFISFLEIYKKDMYPQLREHTIQSKEYKHKRITPYFEDKPINSITPKDVKKWQNLMVKDGFSSRYIKNLQAELSAVLNHAVKYYNLSKNPVTDVGPVKLPNEMPKKMRFWTFDEFKSVIGQIDDIKSKTAINLLYWTGMRKGELYALTWSDIDFNTKVLSINKSFQRLSGKDVITPTKTYESRKILLPDIAVNMLKEYKDLCYSIDPDDYIFIWEKTFIESGIKEGTEKANELIKANNKELGTKTPLIKRIHIHGLRHSHASYLINKGVNIVLISKRLGHKDTSMTLNTYSHFFPTEEDDLIKQINKEFN